MTENNFDDYLALKNYIEQKLGNKVTDAEFCEALWESMSINEQKDFITYAIKRISMMLQGTLLMSDSCMKEDDNEDS